MWRMCLTSLTKSHSFYPARLKGISLKARYSTPSLVLERTSKISLQFDNIAKKGLFKRSNEYLVPHRQLQLSSRRDLHPLIWVVIRPVFKIAALLTGRGFRKWWQNLPSKKREYFYSVMKKNSSKILAAFSVCGGLMWYYYLSHIQETPITKRRRFMGFNARQMKQIGEMELKQVVKLHENEMLPQNHPYCQRVISIVQRLLRTNKDIKEIRDKIWSIAVINSPEENAFVLPNGEIFVFTGMLKLCSNDDQLGTVLAHEMSHCILAHGAENFSLIHLVDCAMIVVIGAIWAILPSDVFAIFTYWLVKQLVQILLNLPYNRKIETEADEVGLILAARACLDIRESSAFWAKMAILSKTYGEIPQIEFLSTHPSHENRSYHLDSLINEALQLRTSSGCPKLKGSDPRLDIEALCKSLEEQRKISRSHRQVVMVVPTTR